MTGEPPPRGAGFRDLQARQFAAADPARFRWTTGGPGFAETEEALLAPVLATMQAPCLEMGCGEGTNLVRLARRGWCVGLDRFAAKVRYAGRVVPHAGLLVGDAAALPLRGATFRTVLIRDLLHHLERPAAALAEAMRVLAPRGRLWILEPNSRNPIISLQAHLVPAEAGLRSSTAERLASLLAPLGLEHLSLTTAQPFPLRRLVLHYRFGLPALGRLRPLVAALQVVEQTASRVLPRRRWAYLVATGERPG